MKYTQAALDVLTCVQLSSESSVKAVAKQLGMQEHTARYHLLNLLQSGALRPYTFIDVYPLGLFDHAVYFSLSEANREIRERLVKECGRREGICWLSELGGDYQYAVAFKARDVMEVHDEILLLAEGLGAVFHERAHATRVQQIEYGIRSLSPASVFSPPAIFGRTKSSTTIDFDDHRLLALMSQSPELSSSKLASSLKMPERTVRYRIGRLEKEGVAARFRYLVDPTKMGLLSCRVLLSCKGISARVVDTLRQFAARKREVSHFVECLGSWDFELQVAIPDSNSLREFCNQLYDELGSHIERMRTITLYEERKILGYPFRECPAWVKKKAAERLVEAG